MGLNETLVEGSLIALDTTPLIYFIEQNPNYYPLLRAFFVALDKRQYEAVTSTLTLTETLVYPIRLGRTDLVQAYKRILLHTPYLTIYGTDSQVAETAAGIRAEYNFRTPDAIQLATAYVAGAAYFLTNDRALRRFDKLKVVCIGDLA
ncbi:MAG: type II toxin-antitoxin system VapC family toxin [Anaerolineales bacterium]|nr:type II toxin-antitoxin system VapC family toxin [Anaerolineales bacterium]